MKIFIKSEESLGFLAGVLKKHLNIADSNITEYQRDQKRESLSYGGEYFLFEVFGIELKLVRNVGEAKITERADCGYYVIVENQNFSNEMASNEICKHLAAIIEPYVDATVIDELR